MTACACGDENPGNDEEAGRDVDGRRPIAGDRRRGGRLWHSRNRLPGPAGPDGGCLTPECSVGLGWVRGLAMLLLVVRAVAAAGRRRRSRGSSCPEDPGVPGWDPVRAARAPAYGAGFGEAGPEYRSCGAAHVDRRVEGDGLAVAEVGDQDADGVDARAGIGVRALDARRSRRDWRSAWRRRRCRRPSRSGRCSWRPCRPPRSR